MKTKSINLLATSCLFCLIISCNGGDKNQAKDESSPVVNTEIVQDSEKVDGPFEIKSGLIRYENRKLDGTIYSTYSFYFDNYGKRLKLEETIDGETSVYLFDDEKGSGLTEFAGRKPSKIRMRQGELNPLVVKHSTSGYTKQANESIAGRDCIVYANNAKSAEGESQHAYWKHKGVLLKEINRLGGGYIIEAISFEEKSLDKEVFAGLD